MKTLEEIKQLMVAGDTAQADAALKELLAAEPDNLQAKMLYGTCRQLLGDEETFKRIHDELVPKMEKLGKSKVLSHTLELWQGYHKAFNEMSDTVTKTILIDKGEFDVPCLYGCPPYGWRRRRIRRMMGCLTCIFVLFLFWFAWWLGQNV